eukprot:Tbor_TRINITY_DN6055_c1_g7::TRINITY_DN6055_c1_g7_i1::g.10581::m.10581
MSFMTILNDTLPTYAPPQACLINGIPLNEVLTIIANTLRAQHEELQEHKAKDENDKRIINERLQVLEDKVSNIEYDLNISARPINAYGMATMDTLYDHLTTCEYRLHRGEKKNKTQTYFILLNKTNKERSDYFFSKWLRWRNARASATALMHRSHLIIRLRTYKRWKLAKELIQKERREKKALRFLLYNTAKELASLYLKKWKTWHKETEEMLITKTIRDNETAETIANIANRGLVRRYFAMWATYQDHLRYIQGKYNDAIQLEVSSHRKLAQNTYEKWEEFTNYRLFEVRRRRIIVTKHKQALRTIALRYLYKWCTFVKIVQRREAILLLVTRMHHAAIMRIGHRYFNNILRFVNLRQQQREQKEVFNLLSSLSKKYDILGEQLDMGLDNLSHTNGVLSRVVDTLLLTSDAPQVQSLLSVHRGDMKLKENIKRNTQNTLISNTNSMNISGGFGGDDLGNRIIGGNNKGVSV